MRDFCTFYTHYIIYRHIGDTILCIDFTLIIQHDGGRYVVLFCRAWVNYTFLLFICLYNYTFSLFSCLQNYTFLYFDYLQNYTFLYFDYSGNYTFSLFLSFEVFCRLITESGGMANLKMRGRRVEVSRGGTSERFTPKTFTVPVRPEVKAFFAMPRLKRGAKEAKLVPLCTKKGRRQKNIKRNRARGARIHLSYLYVFQGYMHFLQTLHSWGLKFDNQRGLVCRVWCTNPTQNPSLCRVLRRSV